MKEQDIDKFFRDKLANHTKQPLPQTWEKINAALQAKKKRRAIIAWRMAAGVALLAGVAWLTVNFDDKRAENIAVVSKITKETLQEVAISKIEVSKTEISEIEVTKTKVQKIKVLEAEIAKTTNKILQNKQKLEIKEVNKISNSNQVANKIEENIAIQTLEILPKTSNEMSKVIANEIKNEVATHVVSEVKNEDTIEVIVKLGNGNTEIDSTNIIASTTKKRTFLGKIWQKVKEGETLTLRDVGVKPPKLPNFLRKSE
jgi:hypothetical protein